MDPIPRNKSGAKGIERLCESITLQDDTEAELRETRDEDDEDADSATGCGMTAKAVAGVTEEESVTGETASPSRLTYLSSVGPKVRSLVYP